MHRVKLMMSLLRTHWTKCTSTRSKHDYALLNEKAFINGQWKQAESGATFQVTNPASGEIICSVSDCSVTDVDVAVEAAHTSFEAFKMAAAKERAALLHKFFELHTKCSEDLARLLTAENGKPLGEARAEINYGGSFLEWFSEEARRIYGDVVASPTKGRELIFIKQPVGVAAIITPWNFPNAMITRKIGAALAAGCPCVIKPAPETPLSALALAQLAEEAGFPPGTLNVLPSSEVTTPSVGLRLCEHPDIAALSFTGSSSVGKLLLRQSASTVKKVSLELGGNAPFIVFDSANVEKAVAGVMACKFRNAGQTCVSANRIMVQEGIYNQFMIQLAETMQEKLVVGDGFDAATTVGPLINEKAVSKMKSHISDAVDKGGKIVVGGKKHALGGNFFEPTLITDITSDMLACTEETFGPLASIIKFKTEDEAVKLSNSVRVGLAGYFYTEDISQAWRVAKNLEVGMVGVNEGMLSCAEAAFGGVKESGLGREGSRYGIDEFTAIKYICFGGLQ